MKLWSMGLVFGKGNHFVERKHSPKGILALSG